ncbi:MAG: aminotransferase class V-fold PLP-dependent enzyme [Ilumatobacter sp.]|nr:aminotransferase class V-fold PLP-dependent enzyme [Ilumatobacter sp.]
MSALQPKFAPDLLGDAAGSFASHHPEFDPDGAHARMRASDYGRLDDEDQVYLDYTGGGLHAASQIDAHAELLRTRVLGNPHSANPTSLAMTELVEGARRYVGEFFGAPHDEYLCVFTPNASGALRLVGESYRFEPGGRFALTFDNHNSVNGIREFAKAKGAEVTYVPVVAPELRLDRAAMSATLAAADPDRHNLLAFPAQSNYSGVQHPLDLVDEARDAGWDVLVDMAAFAPTNRVDIAAVRPDFAAFSFYKLMGFPTGIGCLLIRKERLHTLHRPWFAGGTITIASVQGDGYYLHDDEAGFEDGTVDYLNIPAVETGLRHLERIGVDATHERVANLTEWLLDALTSLRHSNGEPLVQVFGPTTTEARGGTVSFVMHDPAGRPIDDRRVEELANGVNISLRTGCFCNPGAGEIAHGLTADDMREFFGRDDAVSFMDLRREMLDRYDLLVAAIRVSVGVASNFTDVYRLVCFLQGFLDRSTDEIGEAEFVATSCRIIRDSA